MCARERLDETLTLGFYYPNSGSGFTDTDSTVALEVASEGGGELLREQSCIITALAGADFDGHDCSLD